MHCMHVPHRKSCWWEVQECGRSLYHDQGCCCTSNHHDTTQSFYHPKRPPVQPVCMQNPRHKKMKMQCMHGKVVLVTDMYVESHKWIIIGRRRRLPEAQDILNNGEHMLHIEIWRMSGHNLFVEATVVRGKEGTSPWHMSPSRPRQMCVEGLNMARMIYIVVSLSETMISLELVPTHGQPCSSRHHVLTRYSIRRNVEGGKWLCVFCGSVEEGLK